MFPRCRPLTAFVQINILGTQEALDGGVPEKQTLYLAAASPPLFPTEVSFQRIKYVK